MKAFAAIFFFLTGTGSLFSQTSWSLDNCIDYALNHNITIAESELQSRFDLIALQESKADLYPSVNAQQSAGLQTGRSIDRPTNQYAQGRILFSSHNLSIEGEIFNWFRKKNLVLANKYLLQSSLAKHEKAKQDVTLNVLMAFLTCLLNKEQMHVGKEQVIQSNKQLSVVQRQFNAGTLTKLNVAEARTKLISDSAMFISASENFKQSLIQLQALLGMKISSNFDIISPRLNEAAIPVIPAISIDDIQEIAIAQLPQTKIYEYALNAAQKKIAVARSIMYPTFTMFGALGTNYSDRKYPVYENVTVPSGYVKIFGVVDTVFSEISRIGTGYVRDPFHKQLVQNFGQNLGLTMSIPIFNGGKNKANLKRALLNYESVLLEKKKSDIQLKAEISIAVSSAEAGLKKYRATKEAERSAQLTFQDAEKLFLSGALKPIDLFINQNNYFKAKIENISSLYEYIFKMKLLEFYMGKKVVLDDSK